MYSEKSPDDRQRNCPKHVEFYSKNKFEKLMHLVGFIIRIYHDARSFERQIRQSNAVQFDKWHSALLPMYKGEKHEEPICDGESNENLKYFYLLIY